MRRLLLIVLVLILGLPGRLAAQEGNLNWQTPPPLELKDETPLPAGASARLGTWAAPLVLHGFSPDGNYLATTEGTGYAAGRQCPIRIWETATGKNVQTLRGNDVGVLSAVFSPDNKVLASGGMDDTLWFWDLDSGKEIARVNHQGHVYSIAISADGKYLATGSTQVRLWELKGRQEIKRLQAPAQANKFDTEFFVLVLFSPDGKYLVSGSEKTLRLWDVAEGTQKPLPGQTSLFHRLAFASDGKTLYASGWPRCWFSKYTIPGGTREEVDEVKQPGHVPLRGVFSANARLGAWGLNKTPGSHDADTIEVRELATNKALARIKLSSQVSSFVFSPDGRFLAGAGADGELRLVEPWSGKTEKLLVEPTYPVAGLLFDAQGKHLTALTKGNLLRQWAVAARKELRRALFPLAAEETMLGLSPDGKVLITGNKQGTLWLFAAATGKPLCKLEKVVSVPVERALLAFSPDGSRVAVLTNRAAPLANRGLAVPFRPQPLDPVRPDEKADARVVVWDIAGNKEVGKLNAPPRTCSVGFLHNKTLLTSGFNPLYGNTPDTAIHFWDLETSKETGQVTSKLPVNTQRQRSTASVRAMIASRDGKYLAAVEEVTSITFPPPRAPGSPPPPAPGIPPQPFTTWEVQLWDLAARKELQRLPLAFRGQVIFSPDGQLVACVNPQGFSLCELARGTLKTQNGQVTCLAFAPDSQVLATGSGDGTILLWHRSSLFPKQNGQ